MPPIYGGGRDGPIGQMTRIKSAIFNCARREGALSVSMVLGIAWEAVDR